jgi:3-phenylpropionate/trans-cinnamate dioxygenase ferredoxin component
MYIPVARVDEIPPGSMKAVDASGKQILVANVGGSFFAIQRKCPHLGFNLCKGKLREHVVTCPIHHAGFDVRDGSAVGPANMLILKIKTKDAQSFSVKIEGDQVLVAA